MTAGALTLRLMRLDDADDLLEIWNNSAEFDSLSRQLLDEKIWRDTDFDPSLSFVTLDASRIVGFAVGIVRISDPAKEREQTAEQEEQTKRGFVKVIAVRKDCRRRGAAGRLLGAIEQELKNQGCKTVRLGESAPNYLMPGLDPRYTNALLFFEKHGYVRFNETYNLTVDLDAFDDAGTFHIDRALQEKGVEIRRATQGDEARVMDFLSNAWSAWKPEVGNCFANRPISLHLALRGDLVLGFSAYDGNNAGTGWFGPMLTDESARGFGIGSILLKRCLADIKSQGKSEAIIPWVGPIGFYAHHVDARISRVFYRMEKRLVDT